MISLLNQLDPSKFVFSFVLAKTDVMSMKQLLSSGLKERGFLDSSEADQFHLIQRPREVKQSYFSSIFTTLRSFLEVLVLVLRLFLLSPSSFPHLVLMNGPSLCVPFAVTFFLLKFDSTKPSLSLCSLYALSVSM